MTYAPLVWQCRYSGVEVPEQLWRYVEFGQGKKYSENQAEHIERDVYGKFDQWINEFAEFVQRKGKVPAGKYRAFGYKPPKHRWADAKLKWREWRMQAGRPPKGSSPAVQQERGLNRDRGKKAKQSEGKKLRGRKAALVKK